MSYGAVYQALIDVERLGYVHDDAPDGVVRKSKRALYAANNQLFAEVLGASVAHFVV
jgi:hypothetical protein